MISGKWSHGSSAVAEDATKSPGISKTWVSLMIRLSTTKTNTMLDTTSLQSMLPVARKTRPPFYAKMADMIRAGNAAR